MKTPEFFRFVGGDCLARPDRTFNGLLAFIPQPNVIQQQGYPLHVAFEGGDFQWLEIKDHLTSEKLRVDLLAGSPRYWLLFQMAGTSQIDLPHPVTVAEGRCYGFGSRRRDVPMVLAKGHVWLLLVACNADVLPRLADEFGQLAGLRQLLGKEGDPTDPIVLGQPIDYVQRRRMQALEKMEYKPFSTPVLLAEWMLRTLQHLFQPSQAPTHAHVSLYHEALRYIRKNYMDDISNASIAEALHVSVRTLSRAFENRPLKIVDEIHNVKLGKAREMLYTTDLSIEEISRELNFSCPKYFSNRYKQHFFESPAEFRLQHGFRRKG